MKNITLKSVLIISGILFWIVLLIFFFNPITTTFNVNVNTERLIFKTKDLNNSRLIFDKVEVVGLDTIIYSNFTGSFEVGENIEVQVERIAYGAAIITIESNNETTGKLYSGKTGKFLTETPHFVEFVIDSIQERTQKGQTIILPVDGEVQLGRGIDLEIFGESTSLLRSGEITLNGQSSDFFQDIFDAGTVKLSIGDQLIVDSTSNKAFGFATINENPGIQAAYRFKAKQARILKPGPRDENAGIIIKATPLDRLLHASSVQSISMFFGTLLIIMSIVSFSMDIYNFRNNFKKIFK